VPAVVHFPKSAQWPHYLGAVVDIALTVRGVHVVPGCQGDVPSLPHPLGSGRTIHIVTAFNPGGREAGVRANLRAQEELLRIVARRGLRWWPAVGRDPAGAHAEISVAVAGLSDTQARSLGRRFGQDAVFAWSSASWRLLACEDAVHDVVVGGWHASDRVRR